MALSDIKGERVFEVYAAIVPYMAAIAKDKDIRDAYDVEVGEGEDAAAVMIGVIEKLLPVALARHRDELAHIFAAIDGKSPEDYAVEDFDALRDFAVRTKGLMADRLFLNFLR